MGKQAWRYGLIVAGVFSAAALMVVHFASRNLYNSNAVFVDISRNQTANISLVKQTCDEKFDGRIPSPQQLKQYRETEQIFYNRMPKCGSTMAMNLLRKLAKKNKWNYPGENAAIFTLTKNATENWVPTEQLLMRIVHMVMDHKKPMLSSCHLVYTDFSRLWTGEPPTYINIIRDPQQRLISYYYYFRFCPGHTRTMSNATRYRTYDDCVKNDIDECVGAHPKGYWTLVPYFCGHDPVCRTPSRTALEIAKANVIKSHAVVGFTEDMETFTKVLEHVIPRYFKDMSTVYKKMIKTGKASLNKNGKSKIKPKPETLAKMKPLLKLENEFYEFVKNRLYSLDAYLKCKKNIS